MNTARRYALIMLPIWLALIPLEVSAQGPALVAGDSTRANVLVDTVGSDVVAWNTLLSVVIFIPDSRPWRCAATASAETNQPAPPGSVDNQYRFTLTLDDTSPAVDGILNGGCQRTLDIDHHVGLDPTNNYVIGTTCPFTVRAGFHIIRWLATKVAAGDEDLTVLDSSVTVVCSEIPEIPS
jgi:hypothetical protein